MKKQTEIMTTTAAKPAAKKIELIFLVVVAAIFYRNYSNRRLPNMPPNSLSVAKQLLQSLGSGLEKMIGRLSNFFYNVTGESLIGLLQFLAIGALIVLLVIGVVYIIKTH